MDFGVNPLTQFHAAPTVSYEGNLQAPYVGPSTHEAEALMKREDLGVGEESGRGSGLTDLNEGLDFS